MDGQGENSLTAWVDAPAASGVGKLEDTNEAQPRPIYIPPLPLPLPQTPQNQMKQTHGNILYHVLLRGACCNRSRASKHVDDRVDDHVIGLSLSLSG